MKLSLSVKIIVSVAFLAIILFASLAYLSLTNRKKDLISLYTEGARVATYSLSSNINTIEDLQDKDHIFLMIKNMIWLDADIIHIYFTLPQDGDMITYVSNDSASDGRSADAENREAYTKDTYINTIVRSGDSQLLKVFAPLHISGKVVGTVQIDFTLESINSRIKAAAMNLVMEFMAMGVVFLMLVYVILRLLVLNPIHKIAAGLQAIQSRNFDVKVDYTAKDEFGDLVDFFNKTTVVLKENDIALKSRNQELETLVAARTEELQKEKVGMEQIISERTEELQKAKDGLEVAVNKRTEELNQKVQELEELNRFMIHRETKMVELKGKISELEAKIEKHSPQQDA